MVTGWKGLLAAHGERPEVDFWDTYLQANPDVLNRLLADLYQAVHGSERPPTLEILWDLVAAPKFAVVPFGRALLDQLGDRSVRSLALQIGIHHVTLQRHVNGFTPIVNLADPMTSMRRIEVIAAGLRIHPSYFMEWRRLWIMAFLDTAFTATPELSVGIFKRFSGLQPTSPAPDQNGR